MTVWMRDVDGTGSLHLCAKGDPGAMEYVPARSFYTGAVAIVTALKSARLVLLERGVRPDSRIIGVIDTALSSHDRAQGE